jgi:hypothetical protein
MSPRHSSMQRAAVADTPTAEAAPARRSAAAGRRLLESSRSDHPLRRWKEIRDQWHDEKITNLNANVLLVLARDAGRAVIGDRSS